MKKIGVFNSFASAKHYAAAAYPFEPCVVRFTDGSYDWFPRGETVGRHDDDGHFEIVDNYTIVAKIIGQRWKIFKN